MIAGVFMLLKLTLLLTVKLLLSLNLPPLYAWTHTTTGVFKIVGVRGTATQHFPESYVTKDGFIRRWKVKPYDLPAMQEWTENVKSPHSPPESESRFPSDGMLVLIRPTIEFLIKSGSPTYVFAGLETKGSDEPRFAHQWITFETTVEPKFRMVVFRGPGDGTDDRLAIVTPDEMRQALERFGNALSNAGSDNLTTGIHVVSVPLIRDWLSVRRSSSELNEKELVTCALTAERDPREVFALSDDLIEMTATSLLRVDASSLSMSRMGVNAV